MATRRPHLLPYYRLNPIERFTEAFRNTVYDGRLPTLSNVLYLIGLSLVTLVIGYVVFKRYEGRLAEEL